MPKEYINNKYYGQTAERSEFGSDGEPFTRVFIDDSAIKVGWTKDADHVEIAVVHHRNCGDDGISDWHAQMDRAGLNRLIRTLRKARDDAYGSDA